MMKVMMKVMMIAMMIVIIKITFKITFFSFCLIGWLNFILKKRCTISRGAEPHAQKANDEKTMMIGPC